MLVFLLDILKEGYLVLYKVDCSQERNSLPEYIDEDVDIFLVKLDVTKELVHLCGS